MHITHAEQMLKTVELLDSILDLHLKNCTPEEWLQRIAALSSGCAAASISWPGGSPEMHVVRCSQQTTAFPAAWVASADAVIRNSSAPAGKLLEEIATDSAAFAVADLPMLQEPNLLIGCVDAGLNCTLLVLRCDDKPSGWLNSDRERFCAIMPTLAKAQSLHKHVVTVDNRLDMANCVLNGAPRGVVGMTPHGNISKANDLAHAIMARNEGFEIKSGALHIQDAKVFAQFNEQLEKIHALDAGLLDNYVWNRTFVSSKSSGYYQLVLRAYAFENWAVEASEHDRFVVLFIHTPKTALQPSARDLQDFYDLSAAQARVVVCMLDGHSVADAAEQLHLSIYTVRSHLRAIYAQLDVSSQSDLMRLLSMTLVNYEPAGSA